MIDIHIDDSRRSTWIIHCVPTDLDENPMTVTGPASDITLDVLERVLLAMNAWEAK